MTIQTIEFEWTDGNDVNVYLDGAEILTAVSNPGDGCSFNQTGTPVNLHEALIDWVAQTLADGEITANQAIVIIGKIAANSIEEIEGQ